MFGFEEVSAVKQHRKKELLALSERIGVNFRTPELLDLALTHISYANEHEKQGCDNERLEFLGDAVLELVTSSYLYKALPNLPEGELTKIRASIVCSQTLSSLALKLGLGEYLLLSHGEAMSGGRTRQTNLEDAFEAVIGAVYLDAGWEQAQRYVLTQLNEVLSQAVATQNVVWQDNKTVLQETVGHIDERPVTYELIGETGPDHAKQFTSRVKIRGKVMGEGIGSSKKESEQQAAKAALKKMTEEKKNRETS